MDDLIKSVETELDYLIDFKTQLIDIPLPIDGPNQINWRFLKFKTSLYKEDNVGNNMETIVPYRKEPIMKKQEIFDGSQHRCQYLSCPEHSETDWISSNGILHDKPGAPRNVQVRMSTSIKNRRWQTAR